MGCQRLFDTSMGYLYIDNSMKISSNKKLGGNIMVKNYILKNARNVCVVLLAIVMVFSAINIVDAEENKVLSAEEFNNGDLSNILTLLNEYVLIKEYEIIGIDDGKLKSELLEIAKQDSIVLEDELRRSRCMQNNLLNERKLESVNSVFYISDIEYVSDVVSLSEKVKYSLDESKEYIELKVDEWVEIQYSYENIEGINNMSFETVHTMVLEKADGKYYLISDIYCESDINSFVSSEYISEKTMPEAEVTDNLYEKTSMSELIEELSILNGVEALRRMRTGNMERRSGYLYDVATAIDYAQRWTTNSGEYEHDGFNPYYKAYGKNDCCNYVS